MAKIIVSDDVGTGVRLDLGNDDDAYIGKGVTVGSEDATAISGSGSTQVVNVQGTVIGRTTAISLGDDASSDYGDQVLVSKDAYVGAFDFSAIHIRAYESSVTNLGTIWSGLYGVIIAGARAGTSTITNSGTIEAWEAGISHGGSDHLIVQNSGTISSNYSAFVGNDFGDEIHNTGTITGNIVLRGGNDVFDSAGGMFKGVLYAGEGADRIVCGAGTQTISGNDGKDRLFGGMGRDTFVFDTALDAKTNLDNIGDFSVKDDTIDLRGDVFEGLKEGALGKAAFTSGTTGKALDASDRIIYETDTGRLLFDQDGAGGEDAIAFARIAKSLALTNADFRVYVLDLPAIAEHGLF